MRIKNPLWYVPWKGFEIVRDRDVDLAVSAKLMGNAGSRRTDCEIGKSSPSLKEYYAAEEDTPRKLTDTGVLTLACVRKRRRNWYFCVPKQRSADFAKCGQIKWALALGTGTDVDLKVKCRLPSFKSF